MKTQALLDQQINENPVPVEPPICLKMKIEQSQETIYCFVLELVKQEPPKQILFEFKCLFFEDETTLQNVEAKKALLEIIVSNNEQVFINTLKRCCYILINNWETERHSVHILSLVKNFAQLKLEKLSFSFAKKRLNHWVINFVNSQDYQELSLFIHKYKSLDKQHWSERYIDYLLVPQYVNSDNSQEQRKAARFLSYQLKQKFKFELAMYTAHSQSAIKKEKRLSNPTGIGQEVLRLIKILLVKRGIFNHPNLAHLFLKQTQGLSYLEFKSVLCNYLIFTLWNQNFINCLESKLFEKVKLLYQEYNDKTWDNFILLRTCNRIIDYLTVEELKEPSELFIALITQTNPLILVIILLKLILICPQARPHLENKIAELIKYYMNYPEDKCQWVINFFEIFNITFAIYADKDVQYNLIKMKTALADESLDDYRIFSQYRGLRRILNNS